MLVDQGVKIDAQVLGATTAGAERAARFLEAVRDSLAKIPRFAAAAGEVRVEQVAKTVQVRLTVPAKAVLAMLAGELASGADPPPPTASTERTEGGARPGPVRAPIAAPSRRTLR